VTAVAIPAPVHGVRYSEERERDAVQLDAEKREAYTAVYDRWKRDLDALHRVLLDREPPDPPHFVALLRVLSVTGRRIRNVRVTRLQQFPVSPRAG
jgi:hypothetical protein